MKRILFLAAFLVAAQLSQAATINTPDVSVSGTSGTWTFDKFLVPDATLTQVTFFVVTGTATLQVTFNQPLPAGCSGGTGSPLVVGGALGPSFVFAGRGTCNTSASLSDTVTNRSVNLVPLSNFVGPGTVGLSYSIFANSFRGTARLVYTYDEAATGVPEPGTMGLMGFGFGAVALLARRRAR